ncbi:MAG: hypothetical protein ACYSWO_29800 [Planctomycetota bacterium]
MKRIFGIVVLAILAVVIVSIGCKEQGAQEGQSSAAKYQIAVIPKGTTHIFWKSIHFKPQASTSRSSGKALSRKTTGNHRSESSRISSRGALAG